MGSQRELILIWGLIGGLQGLQEFQPRQQGVGLQGRGNERMKMQNFLRERKEQGKANEQQSFKADKSGGTTEFYKILQINIMNNHRVFT